jgi:hypothetical protein
MNVVIPSHDGVVLVLHNDLRDDNLSLFSRDMTSDSYNYGYIRQLEMTVLNYFTVEGL